MFELQDSLSWPSQTDLGLFQETDRQHCCHVRYRQVLQDTVQSTVRKNKGFNDAFKFHYWMTAKETWIKSMNLVGTTTRRVVGNHSWQWAPHLLPLRRKLSIHLTGKSRPTLPKADLFITYWLKQASRAYITAIPEYPGPVFPCAHPPFLGLQSHHRAPLKKEHVKVFSVTQALPSPSQPVFCIPNFNSVAPITIYAKSLKLTLL